MSDYSFATADLTAMREMQDGHMLDTGNVQPITATVDSYGQAVETWPTNSAAIACGLDMRPGSERHGVEKTIIDYDATARVPLATTVDMRDHFRVTKRFGETLSTALVFSVAAPPQRGPSGLRLLLKRIET